MLKGLSVAQLPHSSIEESKPMQQANRTNAAPHGDGAIAETGAAAARASREVFGRLDDGRVVERVTLCNANGVLARVIAYGATLQSLEMPDRKGRRESITLGHPTLDAYVQTPQYLGATVGRYANRLAKGRFSLDGRQYAVAANDGPHALHGGSHGFDKALWTVTRVGSHEGQASVTMTHVSPDGDMGYPGTLTVTATFMLDQENRLTLDYRASVDMPTVVNLTHHAFWNLGGEGSQGILDQQLMIPAERYLQVDQHRIPLGKSSPVADSPFDFRKAKSIGRDMDDPACGQLVQAGGYDHCWVFDIDDPGRTRVVACAEDLVSGRRLTMSSNQPGLQFYSGNAFDGTTSGPSGRAYGHRCAFALEPQRLPDTPNQPSFGSARLDPGQQYHNRIIYSFSLMKNEP